MIVLGNKAQERHLDVFQIHLPAVQPQLTFHKEVFLVEILNELPESLACHRDAVIYPLLHPEEHPPVERYEFRKYTSIVRAYVDEKRYDEALSILDEMKEKFPYQKTSLPI